MLAASHRVALTARPIRLLGTLGIADLPAPQTRMSTSTAADWSQRWQRFAAASLRSFHTYANWLVGISWRRFAVLAVLLLIAAAFLREVPPFSWSYTRKLPHH